MDRKRTVAGLDVHKDSIYLCIMGHDEPLTESFNFHRLNAETFDTRALADAVENLPMMADRTLIQVDDIDLFKLSEGDRTRIAELLGDIDRKSVV